MAQIEDFYVYALFRPDCGLPFYIGKGRGDRWFHHECPSRLGNSRKDHIIRKARSAGLRIPKVKLASGLTEQQAFDFERAFILALGRGKNALLANQTDGGEGASGAVRTDAEKARISAMHKGKTRPPEWRKRISEGLQGLRQSPESIAKMAESKRGKKLSIEHRGKISVALKGKPISEEARRKISETNKGRTFGRRGPVSDATKQAISVANFGRRRSAEAKALMSRKAKEAWARRRMQGAQSDG